MRRRLPHLVFLFALLAALIGMSAMPAQASVSTSYCNGKSYKSRVKTYYRGSAPRPLRCGKTSWGFRHLVAKDRWNSTFDSKIALTISRGASVQDYQEDGGSRIYALFNDQCVELFRVIYNSGAYLGHDVKPQGVITTYYRGTWTTSPESAESDTTATYRQDCPVYQTI